GQALPGPDLVLRSVNQSVHIPTRIRSGKIASDRITPTSHLLAHILNVTTNRAYKPLKPRLQMLSILRSLLVNVLFKLFNVGQSTSLLFGWRGFSRRLAGHLVVPILSAPHKCRVIFTAWRKVVRARRSCELAVEADVLARLRPA